MAADTQTTTSQTEGTRADSEKPFDPDRLAHYEIAGWKAYYAHQWLRFLILLLRLEREQFGFSWLRALQGAYYTARAAIAWVPQDHDLRKVRLYLRKFYGIANRFSTHLRFNPRKAADVDVNCWHHNRTR